MTDRRTVTVLAAGWLGPVVAAVAAALILRSWTGPWDTVRGSTDAWLLAHVHRVLLTGSWPAAVATSMIPNTTWNPLFPAICATVSAASGLPPTGVGHAVAAGAWGFALVALFALWRAVGERAVGERAVGERAGGARAGGGWALGALGAGGLLFPPVVTTASMARYDTLGMALVLGAGALAAAALRVPAGGRGAAVRWGLAGLCAGLAHLAREFLVGPALGGLGVALLVLATRPVSPPERRWRSVGVATAALAAGLLAGLVPLPLALGVSPAGGWQALLGFGVHNRFGAGRPMVEVLYLHRLALPLAAGALGLVLAAVRGPGRAPARILLGILLPYGAFLLSRQQSPQYYLLAHALLLSGLAGWVAWVPWPPVRTVVALAGLGGAILLVREPVPASLVSGAASRTFFHSEGWPAWPDEPLDLVERALSSAPARPLLFVSGTVENLDALATIRYERPVGFLFREWAAEIPQAASLYEGETVRIVWVEDPTREMVPPDGATLVDTWTTDHLVARVWDLPAPARAPSREEPCARGGHYRGACLQAAWLAGGQAEVRTRMLREVAASPGLRSRARMGW